MRTAPALLALLLAVGALPWAPAQAQAAPALLQDSAGDLQATVAGTPAGAPAGRFAATDLVSLAVEETAADFTVRLGVASLAASPEAPFAEGTMYAIDFTHQGMGYRVLMFRQVSDQARYFGRAYVYDEGRGAYSQLEPLPVTADAASGTMAAVVPRTLLLDENGAAPFPGRALAGFRAQSSSLAFFDRPIGLGPAGSLPVPPTGVRDAMPDSGAGGDYAVRLGLVQQGDAQLKAAVPVRASNGEATTFVFPVNATNLGAEAKRFSLAAVGAPATWQVDLPSDLVEIPGGSSITVPVLVSTPFAHAHGTLQSFVLEMAGVDDPGSVGRVQLGVRYVQPPQPAGHHDTQYLHTFSIDGDPTLTTLFSTLFGFDPNQMYFNTLRPEDDPNDARAPVGGSSFGFGAALPPQQEYVWFVPLSPGLSLGLDFDPAREGSIKAAVNTLLPMPGAVLSGRLVHTVPDGRDCDGGLGGDDGCTLDDFVFGTGAHVTAATVGPSAAQDVGPNTAGAQFEAAIRSTPAGDYLPFHPDATLVLQLNLTFTRADPFFGPKDAPKLAGGEMVLPLLEYHDPVDQVFSSLSSLMVAVRGEQSRLVNPGATALYELELMNHGESSASYDLELTGTGLPWARILGDRRVSVAAGETRVLGIAVTAPAGAADGEASDLVLAAVDTRDPAARTLARLLTTVDTEAEHPDDSARVPGLDAELSRKGAPPAGAPASLLALAALALAVRRARR